MRWLNDRAMARLREMPGLAPGPERYELRDAIGRGGMSVVYRAFDRELARDVALKVLDAHVPGAAERLLQEARILARLEHPGILPIHDVGTMPDGRLFYVMKLVRGRRLDQYAAQAPSLSDRLRIFDRLCEAVAFAHARHIIHRDLKPENVMIGSFGEVLTLDWGIAKVLGGEPPEEVGVIGTPGYMAPEQAGGRRDVDERADVYGLGAILAFLLRAVPPVHIPRALSAIVARACEASATARYPSVDALAADVRRYVAGLAVDAYRESLLERARRLVRRHRTPILLVSAYLVIRVILLLAWGV